MPKGTLAGVAVDHVHRLPPATPKRVGHHLREGGLVALAVAV
jgi:hypothetical protein